MGTPFSSLNILECSKSRQIFKPYLFELYVTMKGILEGQVDKYTRGVR